MSILNFFTLLRKVENSDFEHFFENGTNAKILSEIKLSFMGSKTS